MLEYRDSDDRSYDWVKGEIGPKDMRSVFTKKTLIGIGSPIIYARRSSDRVMFIITVTS